MTMVPVIIWYEDHTEVLTFARVLVDYGAFRAEDQDDALINLLYYFEKPHKWVNEHARWIKLGRPEGRDISEDILDVMGNER